MDFPLVWLVRTQELRKKTSGGIVNVDLCTCMSPAHYSPMISELTVYLGLNM